MMDETLPPPSREAVLADLKVLAQDFGRLFATDCECVLRTDRHYWPSRFPDGGHRAFDLRKDNQRYNSVIHGNGFEVNPEPVRAAGDTDGAPLFYLPSGEPAVNACGHSMFVAPGFDDKHEIVFSGPGSLRAKETIDRANAWVKESTSHWVPLLWFGRSFTVRGFSWPDVVARVAEEAKRSTLKPNDWHVTAGQQSYNLSVWRRRDELGLGGPMVTPEIAERIGDDPEDVWAERRAFLRDSESAAHWLIDALAEPVGDEITADNQGKQDAIAAAALRAVVDGNLAGVLQAAVGTRAVDRVTALIRDRVVNDQRLYERKADHWAEELRVTKKTITDSEGWREIMEWRAANKADRVSKKTGK
jgi:hypothetical protein